MHVRECMCVCACTCVHACVCVSVCMCVSMRVHVCVRVHECVTARANTIIAFRFDNNKIKNTNASMSTSKPRRWVGAVCECGEWVGAVCECGGWVGTVHECGGFLSSSECLPPGSESERDQPTS